MQLSLTCNGKCWRHQVLVMAQVARRRGGFNRAVKAQNERGFSRWGAHRSLSAGFSAHPKASPDRAFDR
jgi:hypothetical protein